MCCAERQARSRTSPVLACTDPRPGPPGLSVGNPAYRTLSSNSVLGAMRAREGAPIGADGVIEALRDARRKRVPVGSIYRVAKICRFADVILSCLESAA